MRQSPQKGLLEPKGESIGSIGFLGTPLTKTFLTNQVGEIKSRTMTGYDAPYVPGWDCHGLPIEAKIMDELGPKGLLVPGPDAVYKQCFYALSMKITVISITGMINVL